MKILQPIFENSFKNKFYIFISKNIYFNQLVNEKIFHQQTRNI